MTNTTLAIVAIVSLIVGAVTALIVRTVQAPKTIKISHPERRRTDRRKNS